MRRCLAICGIFVSSLLVGNIAMAAAADNSALNTQLTKLGYAQGEPVDNIQNYRVDGWNYLDDRHVMIYTGPSSRALITLLTSCPELSSAERIAFTSTTRKLTKFDKVMVRGAGGIKRDCQISEIRQLNSTKTKSAN